MQKWIDIGKFLGGALVLVGFLMIILHFPFALWTFRVGISFMLIGYAVWIIRFFVKRSEYSARRIMQMVCFELSAVTLFFGLIGKAWQKNVIPYPNYWIIAGIVFGVAYFLLTFLGPQKSQVYDLEMFKGLRDEDSSTWKGDKKD